MELPYSNMKMEHWNPGAKRPLILPVHVICNTSDEALQENILANARLDKEWIKLHDAHEGIAVLCGSGPSMADTLEQVRALAKSGAKVFAMNGCAKYLSDNGILPDYQVILDARIESAQLIGPAKEHLFASQVHPECFNRVPNARLWHLQIGEIEKLFPNYEDGYCLIGGAASVGNTATCLAYAMGYRNLQIFGYDSSNKLDGYDGYDPISSQSHVIHQPMNTGEPFCSVMFNGKHYISSLTMKLQAEKFQSTAKALKECGCSIVVHGYGLLPDIYNSPVMMEVDKYKTLWANPDYRRYSPGERVAELFVKVAGVNETHHVVDVGCGSGKGGDAVQKLTGCELTYFDFAENALDPEIKAKANQFVVGDITKNLAPYGDFIFCTDVLEHIPPENVENTLKNVICSGSKSFLQISTVEDSFGETINQDLHLTVQPHSWWKNLIEKSGFTVEWEEERENAALFLVTRPALDLNYLR